MRQASLLFLFYAASYPVLGAPLIDGALDPTEYGAPLSIQNTPNTHENSTMGDLLIGNGSEIDQVFGTVANNRLHLLFTGNLEQNATKLVLFVDSVAGGVNSLDGENLPAQFDSFCTRCGGGFEAPYGPALPGQGGLQRMHGLTFDTGFAADYVLSFAANTETVDDSTSPKTFYALTAYYADLTQGAAGQSVPLGMVLAPGGAPRTIRNSGDGLSALPAVPTPSTPTSSLLGPTLPNLASGQLIDRQYAITHGGCASDDSGTGCIAPELEFALGVAPGEVNVANPELSNGSDHRNFQNSVDLRMAINNSNTAGVHGSYTFGGNPEAVNTGVEFSIPLSAIGNPTGPIRVTAFITARNYDFASNQFSGVGILQTDPGSDGTGSFSGNLAGILLNQYAGNQFVTIANSANSLSGDYDRNGVVDSADYTIWRDTMGQTLTPGSGADGDHSGTVDAADLVVWRDHFGNSGQAAAQLTVPEPSAWLLLSLALAVSVLRQRRDN